MSKRTFQPHRKSRMRTHGFRKRMRTRAGREVIRRRRRKGRRQLTVSVAKKSRPWSPPVPLVPLSGDVRVFHVRCEFVVAPTI